jgi:tetratricopeptide (TPR) repeat protein
VKYTKAALLIGAAASMIGKLSLLPARAESPSVVAQEAPILEEAQAQSNDQSSPLSEFLESNSEAVEALKSLLQQKLESGEDEEALKILGRLVSAQPLVTEWKFLMARLFNELGDAENARKVFEEILALNPLSFEALFENALVMDRCGEGEAVITRLEEALKIAEGENKAKEARDVRFIMAQIQFLQKNVEEALRNYQELAKEDPNDFRPYFCQGMIYSLLERNAEAREQFAKYRELSPKKFEVEGYLRTPLSRMKLFGSDEN